MKKAKGIFGMLERILKPLMNERGAVGDNEAPPAETVTLDENGFIPGTTYKSVPELVKAHGEIKNRFDAQGNELGTLRKVVDTLSKQAPAAPATPAKEKAPDYDSEISATVAAIENLDPAMDNYQSELTKLLKKSNDLTAAKVKDTVLNTAGTLFQEELSKRDQKAALDKFYADYPDFKKPETQAEISDFLSNDTTGMHDKFSAFFKLRSDKALAAVSQKDAENAELQKILDLEKGKGGTGKVIIRGQSPANVTQPKPRVTGKDLDAGMAAAIEAARSA